MFSWCAVPWHSAVALLNAEHGPARNIKSRLISNSWWLFINSDRKPYIFVGLRFGARRPPQWKSVFFRKKNRTQHPKNYIRMCAGAQCRLTARQECAFCNNRLYSHPGLGLCARVRSRYSAGFQTNLSWRNNMLLLNLPTAWVLAHTHSNTHIHAHCSAMLSCPINR